MKIGIIGTGNVGGAIASNIMLAGFAHELVLLDADGARATAAALDLGHAAAFSRRPMKISGGGYKDLEGADIVIISAGANQKPGQPRSDLAAANAAAIAEIAKKIPKSKELILIIVSNPLDSMVMMAQRASKMAPHRVIGTGTMIDSARLRSILSERLNVAPAEISAYVLGEHGDSGFVNWTGASIGAVPLEKFAKLPAAQKTQIEKEVRNAAYKIIEGRGATWDAIGAAASDLARCIGNDERRVLPASIADKAGAHSMPRIIGRAGVIKTMTPPMSASEKKALGKSLAAIRKTFASI
ncbi:MAG: NAD(P)-binding domain-containing protein [Rickettsiales bacterium]|nr:NAD(P)-binding domain-containing protein [Rickettsiales bacterium]